MNEIGVASRLFDGSLLTSCLFYEHILSILCFFVFNRNQSDFDHNCLGAEIADTTRLLRFPATNDTQIVFCYAGEIYTVGKEGGIARRLTAVQATARSRVSRRMGNRSPSLRNTMETLKFTSCQLRAARRSGSRLRPRSAGTTSPTGWALTPRDGMAKYEAAGRLPFAHEDIQRFHRFTVYGRVTAVAVPFTVVVAAFAAGVVARTISRTIIVPGSIFWDRCSARAIVIAGTIARDHDCLPGQLPGPLPRPHYPPGPLLPGTIPGTVVVPWTIVIARAVVVFPGPFPWPVVAAGAIIVAGAVPRTF